MSRYPTSNPKKTDWSKVEHDIKKEDEEYEVEMKKKKNDDEKLMDWFKEMLYNKGDDSVKRAMNKTFVESNGTVLNTNWGEVKDNKIEPQIKKT